MPDGGDGKRLIRLQPSEYVDQMIDGHEMTKLPYPFYVYEDGTVGRQDFWQGDPSRVIGFQKSLSVQHVDLWWSDAVRDPSKAVGMYVVTCNVDGQMGVHLTAIASAEVVNG
jgi:hypothetical protein